MQCNRCALDRPFAFENYAIDVNEYKILSCHLKLVHTISNHQEIANSGPTLIVRWLPSPLPALKLRAASARYAVANCSRSVQYDSGIPGVHASAGTLAIMLCSVEAGAYMLKELHEVLAF